MEGKDGEGNNDSAASALWEDAAEGEDEGGDDDGAATASSWEDAAEGEDGRGDGDGAAPACVVGGRG